MADTAAPDPIGPLDTALTDALPPEAPPAAGFPIVAIGASAGGLAALSQLLENIPADSGLAFVVVTHLEPHHESHMPALLARHTLMPVSHAQDGELVQPDHVYVIPPDALLRIARGTLHLQALPDRSSRPRPIDVFMGDLARDQTRTSVAIVLSGIDADGSVGVKHIKAQGGTVMAQEPQSAEYPDMPRNAVATGLADFVLPPQQMGPVLVDYARKASLRPATPVESPGDMQDIAGILMALLKAGAPDFRDYKPGMIERRVRHRMALMGLPNLAELRKQVETSAETRQLLSNDFLIGVTEFFREPKAWAELAERVLPELLQRTDDRPVRVWVPGCASGEEAYTLAMLLSEQAPSAETRARIEIFATDIDPRALEVARAGIFPASVTHTISPERLRRFFVQVGDSFQVKKELRALVVFSSHNLLVDPPFFRMDIVSCRNLLIYLQSAAQRTLLSSFAFSLNEGGYLFLGRSETLADKGFFEETSSHSRIFKRNAAVRPHAVNFNLAGRGAGADGHGPTPKLRGSDMAQLVPASAARALRTGGRADRPRGADAVLPRRCRAFFAASARRPLGQPVPDGARRPVVRTALGLATGPGQGPPGHRRRGHAARQAPRARAHGCGAPEGTSAGRRNVSCDLPDRVTHPGVGAGGRGQWRWFRHGSRASPGARRGAGRTEPSAGKPTRSSRSPTRRVCR
jgi:two-component system CheB/CheR fusion protein